MKSTGDAKSTYLQFVTYSVVQAVYCFHIDILAVYGNSACEFACKIGPRFKVMLGLFHFQRTARQSRPIEGLLATFCIDVSAEF